VRVPATALLGDWGRALPWRRRAWGRAGAPLHAHHWPVRAGPATGRRARAGAPRLWQALSEQANVQEWLADSRIEIDQARWLVLHAAWLLDQGCRARAGARAGGRHQVVARGCSSAWWTGPCRFLAPWASPDTPWPPSGPGAAPCA
jgi:acyl-CoA dehydrogenase